MYLLNERFKSWVFKILKIERKTKVVASPDPVLIENNGMESMERGRSDYVNVP